MICPFRRISPVIVARGGVRPSTASAVMDLPEPLSPTRPRISPGATDRLTLFRIGVWPIDRLRSRISRTLMLNAPAAHAGRTGRAGRRRSD
ncbi:hypothetical protein D3C87_1990060 [compost metagenome]